MPSDSQHAEFWPSRRVLVTGGSGFLGSHLLERLAAHEPAEIIAPGVEDYDLTEVADRRRTLPIVGPTVLDSPQRTPVTTIRPSINLHHSGGIVCLKLRHGMSIR